MPEEAANRIAAGEVVERPASAVKELMENALDAGARRIEITIAEAGRRLIRVSDDGQGIPAEDLALAFARHATSKLDPGDIFDIRAFGFRGEALASLGAVAEVTLTSRAVGAAEAAAIRCRQGHLGRPYPAARARGTEVCVEGLFSATPARLKFLKSDRAELQAILEAVRRLAAAAPDVAVEVHECGDGDGRTLLRLDPAPGAHARIAALLGRAFVAGSVEIDATRDGIRLEGLAGLPTLARGASVSQY
ncbi:MAG: DNA mismatch repair endonuclease MutL, partial [Pseudomonadota bacterium]